MAGLDNVRSNLIEGVVQVVGHRVLCAVDNAGLQGGVKLGVGNDRCGSAQCVDGVDHDRVGGGSDLQTCEIRNVVDLLGGEDVAEAFLCIEQTHDAVADFLRLLQEGVCQLAVSELPEVLVALEHERKCKQACLRASVSDQGCGRDSCHLDGADAADHVVEDFALCAEDLGVLKVDLDGAAGQSLNLFLELHVDLGDHGLGSVDLCENEGLLRIAGSIRKICRSCCLSRCCFGGCCLGSCRLGLSCLGLLLRSLGCRSRGGCRSCGGLCRLAAAACCEGSRHGYCKCHAD